MKKIHFLLFLILTSAATIFAQPLSPTDSISGGGGGIASIDSSTIAASATYCTACVVDGYVSWELPVNFTGHLHIASPNAGSTFSIQIVQSCRYVVYDTCMRLPRNIFGGGFQINFSVVGNAQVYIGGGIGDTVVIGCKTTPPPQQFLGPAYLDLSTCITPTGIDQPTSLCTDYNYYDIVHLRPVSERNQNSLPIGLYWRWCGEWYNGKKVLIQ